MLPARDTTHWHNESQLDVIKKALHKCEQNKDTKPASSVSLYWVGTFRERPEDCIKTLRDSSAMVSNTGSNSRSSGRSQLWSGKRRDSTGQ